MNNRNNRATRAFITSGSLLAIVFIAIPWVDEYLRLRRDAVELRELETKFVETQQRQKQLDRIEGKLKEELELLRTRSIDLSKEESIRETLIDIVRRSGGRLRRLEITAGDTRVWAIENDDPRSETMPTHGEESRFVLHTQIIELQADGALASVRQILKSVASQGWLMTTKGLTTVPTGDQESPVILELRLMLYGLLPNEREPEDFAQLNDYSDLR